MSAWAAMRDARVNKAAYHSMLAPIQLRARGSGRYEGCCRCLVRTSVVTKLKKYDIVKTLEKQGSWAKVQTTDGQQGWMSVDLGWGW